eukprot:3554180-Rhodomonas_salina.1
MYWHVHVSSLCGRGCAGSGGLLLGVARRVEQAPRNGVSSLVPDPHRPVLHARQDVVSQDADGSDAAGPDAPRGGHGEGRELALVADGGGVEGGEVAQAHAVLGAQLVERVLQPPVRLQPRACLRVHVPDADHTIVCSAEETPLTRIHTQAVHPPLVPPEAPHPPQPLRHVPHRHAIGPRSKHLRFKLRDRQHRLALAALHLPTPSSRCMLLAHVLPTCHNPCARELFD